ncbi:MAG: hypothetical protein ACRDHN_08105 [Thermomicrobiales bacterium]
MTEIPPGKRAWIPSFFVTGTSPNVSWDDLSTKDQLQFLQSIDPGYFEYVAGMHVPNLDTENAIYASIAIRQIHAQAVETFFAVIGSVLQAPDCPAGWILNYRIGDLRGLISSIDNYEPFLNRQGVREGSWKAVVRAIFRFSEDNEVLREHLDASAALWKGLAYHLIHERFDDENSAIKHGLGFNAGEWKMRIRTEGSNVAFLLQDHQFGTRFPRREKIEGKPRQSYLRFQRVNWDPKALANRIPLLVASLRDVINLQIIHHGGGNLEDYEIALLNREIVTEALADPTGASATAWGEQKLFPYWDAREFSKAEILASYDESDDLSA